MSSRAAASCELPQLASGVKPITWVIWKLNSQYWKLPPCRRHFLHGHGLKDCTDVLLSEVGHDGPHG
eukprot:15057068-Heterocapsa_arctica.AAC.1